MSVLDKLLDAVKLNDDYDEDDYLDDDLLDEDREDKPVKKFFQKFSKKSEEDDYDDFDDEPETPVSKQSASKSISVPKTTFKQDKPARTSSKITPMRSSQHGSLCYSPNLYGRYT